MGDKFGRNYILVVQTSNFNTISITLPYTIEFDVTRNILNSANVASIRIYNLSKETRNQLEFNIFNQGAFQSVELLAGYGSNLSLIFGGNITQAWSTREGVNYITQIECFDGGFAYNNSVTNLTFPAGTPNAVVVTALIAKLSESFIDPGVISPTAVTGVSTRGKAYSGSTTDLLGNLTGGAFFIDLGSANVLGNNDCLLGSLGMLTDTTGLIGTPVREQNILTFDIIFEPRLRAGQYFQMALTSNTQWNGFYKATSVKHRGMISGAVCGDLITTVSVYGGTNPTTLKPL